MTTKASLGVVDPEVLDRANHTGEQPISSVTGLQTELDDLQPVSGSWTPSLTGITNAASYDSGGNYYFRVGNMVHCFGWVSITPNSTGTAAIIRMSLPIATTIGSTGDLRGHITTGSTTRAGSVYGNTASDRAHMEYYASNLDTQTFSYSFSYVVQ